MHKTKCSDYKDVKSLNFSQSANSMVAHNTFHSCVINVPDAPDNILQQIEAQQEYIKQLEIQNSLLRKENAAAIRKITSLQKKLSAKDAHIYPELEKTIKQEVTIGNNFTSESASRPSIFESLQNNKPTQTVIASDNPRKRKSSNSSKSTAKSEWAKKSKLTLKGVVKAETPRVYVRGRKFAPDGVLEVNEAKIGEAQLIEVPVFRCLDTGSSTTAASDNDTHRLRSAAAAFEEDTSDAAFEKRHSKYEADEKRRKRWDLQRLREQRYITKLRMAEERRRCSDRPVCSSTSSAADDPLSSADATLHYSVENLDAIEVSDEIPVEPFGLPLPSPVTDRPFTWN